MREEGERCKIVLFRSITNTYLHILCIVEINQYPTYIYRHNGSVLAPSKHNGICNQICTVSFGKKVRITFSESEKNTRRIIHEVLAQGCSAQYYIFCKSIFFPIRFYDQRQLDALKKPVNLITIWLSRIIGAALYKAHIPRCDSHIIPYRISIVLSNIF